VAVNDEKEYGCTKVVEGESKWSSPKPPSVAKTLIAVGLREESGGKGGLGKG